VVSDDQPDAREGQVGRLGVAERFAVPLKPGNAGGGKWAADKAESLTGWKSLYRQLPVFGRLAYPVRVEATKHDRPGRKIPGCPAAVFAAVGTIWGESKLGGRNIKEYLHPRNTDLREVVIRGQNTREADPFFPWGRPMTSWKKQVRAHGVPPGYGIQHPRKDSQR
jgi:hypothetical protein